MLIIADIDDINRQLKAAFSRVKDDVTDIRQSLGEQLSKLEVVNKRLEQYATKPEFYSFVKKLMQKLDDLEASLVKPEELHAVEDNTKAKLEEVNGRIKQLQALSQDVERLKALRERVSAVEGSSLDKSEFKKTRTNLEKDIDVLKELQSQYEKLEEESSSTEKRVKKLEEGIERLSKIDEELDSYKENTDKQLIENVEIIKSGLESLSEELSKVKKLELDKALSSLKSDLLELKDKTATTEELNEANARLREELHQVKGELRKTNRSLDSIKAKARVKETKKAPNFWPFIVILALIAIIVIAGAVYKYAARPKEMIITINISNITEITPAENVTPIQNVSPENVTNVTMVTNATIISELNETALKEKNNSCILKYECQKVDNESVYFDCYYAVEDNLCRCYTGANASCNIVKLRLLQFKETIQSAIPSAPQIKKLPLRYGVALIILLIIILAWIYVASKRNNK